MKIVIDKKDESQTPKVIIDTKKCYYPYAIKNAIELALELDGHDKDTIAEIFGRMPDVECSTES